MIFRKENKYEKKLKYILTFQKYLEYVWKVFGKFVDNIILLKIFEKIFGYKNIWIIFDIDIFK